MRLAVVALTIALAAGCGGGLQSAPAIEARSGWTTYHDERRGYTATFPSDWHRAREKLANLSEPREILSLGTYPLRHRASARCPVPMCPVPALDGLGPTDVLVSVQESSGDGATGAARRRPMRLPRAGLRTPPGAIPCWRGRVRRMAFHGFSDAGRNFYVFVAVGTRVSRRTRRELQRVLDSLRFDPR